MLAAGLSRAKGKARQAVDSPLSGQEEALLKSAILQPTREPLLRIPFRAKGT